MGEKGFAGSAKLWPGSPLQNLQSYGRENFAESTQSQAESFLENLQNSQNMQSHSKEVLCRICKAIARKYFAESAKLYAESTLQNLQSYSQVVLCGICKAIVRKYFAESAKLSAESTLQNLESYS